MRKKQSALHYSSQTLPVYTIYFIYIYQLGTGGRSYTTQKARACSAYLHIPVAQLKKPFALTAIVHYLQPTFWSQLFN